MRSSQPGVSSHLIVVEECLFLLVDSLEAKVRFLQNPANEHIMHPEDRFEVGL